MKKVFIQLISVICLTNLSLANENYYRDHLELQKAWQLSKGSSDVTVAILNSGLNYMLEEFNGKIKLDPKNGSYGFDAVNDVFDPFDSFGLGTQEASLVVGDAFGVAPSAKIVPIRIFDDSIGSSEFIVSKGIEYAISRNVKIILLAIGGRPGNLICESLQHAAQAGILIVAAAGNTAKELTQDDYPTVCKVNNMIVVAASDLEMNLAKYSAFSFKNVHTAAPGEFINTMDHTGSILKARGTSFSTALTAGVAALVMSYNPTYTPAQVKEALIRGVNRSPGLQGKVTSNGVLSAYKAMTVKLD